MRLIADAAIERNYGAISAGANMIDERTGVDGFMDEQDEVVAAGKGRHDLALAAAYRRKKGYFVAGVERGVPRSEFLITRRDQRATVSGEFRATRNKLCEEVLDARTRRDFHRFLRTAGNFSEAAEEQGLDADRRVRVGRCHAAHRRIV